MKTAKLSMNAKLKHWRAFENGVSARSAKRRRGPVRCDACGIVRRVDSADRAYKLRFPAGAGYGEVG
jgi:hypothetical protein